MFNWYNKFMYGRYGIDKLNIALLVAWMVCGFINIFFRSMIFHVISLVFPILFLCRMLSRNINTRYSENVKFERVFNKAKGKWHLQSIKIKQFKTHRFFKCPACKATIRIPKRTGKVNVRCTKCGHQFEKRILF